MTWEGLPSSPLMLDLDPSDLLPMFQIKFWKEGFPSTWLLLLQFWRLTPSWKKTMACISVGLIIEGEELSQPQLTWVSLVSVFPWCTSYISWSRDAWVTISTELSCCCCCQKQQWCWFLWSMKRSKESRYFYFHEKDCIFLLYSCFSFSLVLFRFSHYKRKKTEVICIRE